MANLKDIRDRIKSVSSIQQVTKAMKMVAAAKLRKSQQNMERARPYSSKMNNLLLDMLSDLSSDAFPELQVRDVKNTLIVVVTADRGMAGAFNSNIIRDTEKLLKEIPSDNVQLICVGRKAYSYFKRRSWKIHSYYTDFWGHLNFAHSQKIGGDALQLFLSGKVDRVQVLYNKFISTGSQAVQNERLLPIFVDEGEQRKTADILFEPSKEEIIRAIIPRHLNVQMWQFLLESFASEQAARMVAMENATNNAGDMIVELNLDYNKARQTAITTELNEIVSGANAINE